MTRWNKVFALLATSCSIGLLALSTERLTLGQEPEERPASAPAVEAIPKGVRALMQAKPSKFVYTDFVKRALARRIVPAVAAAKGHVAAASAPQVQNAKPEDVEAAVLAFARELSGITPPPGLDEKIRNQNRKADDLVRSSAPRVGAAPKAIVNSETGETLDPKMTRFDWRDNGWIVRNSGIISQAGDQTLGGTSNCGCCWAFSTIGTFGGANARMNLRLVAGSEQNLLDCVGPANGVANDCSGGWWAFDYLINTGVQSRGSYPYVGHQQSCQAQSNPPYRAVSWRYVLNQDTVPMTDAQRLQIKTALINYGPIAATVYATTTEFSGYGEGSPPISSFPSGNKVLGDDGIARIVDHAIVIVGWDNDKKSWAIKNSWGEGWGKEGFGYVDYSSNNIGYGAAYVIPVRINGGAAVAAAPAAPSVAAPPATQMQSITIPRVFPGAPPSVGAPAPAPPPPSPSTPK
ncbi:MAG: hypothetical protein ABS79_00345 [Planctomycetes bacterium SCN 63-9]|nr:MAG: hypothetical protein ABS79_00345 [Planctomycetes bacterium SCN 63-9]